jgi:hypothetical protein
MSTTLDIAEIIAQTDAAKASVRLEYVRGRTKWEASPASRHQKALQRIERSLRPSPATPAAAPASPWPTRWFVSATPIARWRCASARSAIKRPDLAIFCAEPPDTDEALEVIPAAVVEVLSLGYEDKDLGPDGAPFYLTYGVQDVLIVDPRSGAVYHDTPGVVALRAPSFCPPAALLSRPSGFPSLAMRRCLRQGGDEPTTPSTDSHTAQNRAAALGRRCIDRPRAQALLTLLAPAVGCQAARLINR